MQSFVIFLRNLPDFEQAIGLHKPLVKVGGLDCCSLFLRPPKPKTTRSPFNTDGWNTSISCRAPMQLNVAGFPKAECSSDVKVPVQVSAAAFPSRRGPSGWRDRMPSNDGGR